MPLRKTILATLATFVAIAVIALLVQDRSSPLDVLTDVERAFVIPGATSLGPVGSCGDENVSCDGPDIPASWLTLTWFEVSLPAEVAELDSTANGRVEIAVDVAQMLRGEIDDRVVASIREETLDTLEAAAEQGHRLIGRTDSRETHLAFVAIDDRGRFAAIGPDASLLITVPLARAAAAANAESGEAYLLAILEQ